jgi:hypothetical protein
VRPWLNSDKSASSSELDRLTNKGIGLNDEPIGAYDIVEANAIKGGGRTRRADLADALVLAVTEHRWPRMAVSIASRQ